MALTDKNTAVEDNIIDISIDAIKKTRFRINGDADAIIELNLSDMDIANRLQTGFDTLQESMHDIASLNSDDEDISKKMADINQKMCDAIDYIFDYPVSAICAKGGTMYDLYDGMFRYEHIIDKLSKLYTNNINDQFNKLRKRVAKYTQKYTGKPQPPVSTKRGKKS